MMRSTKRGEIVVVLVFGELFVLFISMSMWLDWVMVLSTSVVVCVGLWMLVVQNVVE